MTYSASVDTRPITVAETQAFARAADKIWNGDERDELIQFIAHSPKAGDVIPGTGGVRKLRWARTGVGKRGGARVIYFYYRPDCPIYLLLAYAKAHASDLSAVEKKGGVRLCRSDPGRHGLNKRSLTMSSFGQDLIAAMEEAAAHALGKGKVARVHSVDLPDVRALRRKLGLSQQAFANAYHIPLATLKGWEQGRRQPDATASAYLSVIACLPDEARDVLRAA